MKEKLDPAAARRILTVASADFRRLDAVLCATEFGDWAACPERACRRRRRLGLERASAPEPPRPRKPIARAELMRRVRGALVQKVAELSRVIAASAR